MSSGTIEWDKIQPEWFQKATEEELRAFVRAVDNGVISQGERLQGLMIAFEKECNRRGGAYNERLNNGEWI